MSRRRKKQKPLWISLPLWAGTVALIGWGLWQAEVFRKSLVAEWGGRQVTTQPAMAVGSATVTAQGAQGGEPWANMISSTDGPTLTGIDGLAIMPLPQTDPEAVRDPLQLESTPAFDAALSADELTTKGRELLNSGQIVPARFALNTALTRTTEPDKARQLREILSALNVPVFMGSTILPEDPAARLIDLHSGDSFLKIARTYGLPAAFVESINPSLNAKSLKPLTGIKIVQGPFHVRIFKQAARADLYAREIYVCSLPIDLPEGNFLPKGDYQISAGTKLQLGSRTWIGFEGHEPATEEVTSGWIFASAGPRGNTAKDRATGIHLSDFDLQQLYNVLTEGRSHLRVDP